MSCVGALFKLDQLDKNLVTIETPIPDMPAVDLQVQVCLKAGPWSVLDGSKLGL